jgi:hypothetical protein
LPEFELEVPEWTGDFDYKLDIGGQPPPTLPPNGTEPEVVTQTEIVMQTVTVVPELR